MSKREIKNSRVIVTGASSGIGRAVSLQLAREGAKLLVVARRQDRLSQLAEEAAAVNGRIEILAGDITDEQTRRRAIEAVQSHFGGLDILINNAGIGALGRFEDNDQERLRAVFEVNFFALAEMTRLALPLLKNGTKPMLVNVSSILGRRGVPVQERVLRKQIRRAGIQRSRPLRIHPAWDRRAGGQSGHDRNRIFRRPIRAAASSRHGPGTSRQLQNASLRP